MFTGRYIGMSDMNSDTMDMYVDISCLYLKARFWYEGNTSLYG